MSSGTVPVARAAGNGYGRPGPDSGPAAMCADWTCVKRDGKVVPFDPDKIRQALRKCFASLARDPAEDGDWANQAIEHITRAVVNNLAAQKSHQPGVEDVQRLVMQQLWSEGLFEYAEHYQNYREERRKARLYQPISPEVAARVLEDQKHFPSDLQYYQFMGKFSRWREEDKRRETWQETCFERVLPWLFRQVPGLLSDAEKGELADAMFNLEASPAMRVVQMAGPALDRCHVGVYNCAYQPIEDLFSFPELLYILMQGTGAGFSVETDYVSELPRIKKQRGKKPETIVVPDHTEGWCDSFHKGLQRWWDGYDVHFDTHLVRKEGARLKTKGGRASGPGPLLELFAFARNMVMARQGRYLEDTDCHRLGCFTGRIVQVGGVRRSSSISLSDLLSLGMRGIKMGNWWQDKTYWQDGKYLSMANNSAVYDTRPSVEVFMEEFLALVKSKAGERGVFNREAAVKNRPRRRKAARFGANPCCEIILRPYEFCNLSIGVARPDDTAESLARKVRLSTIFGVIQSLCTNFGYIRPEWKKNCEEERLLGVDITGHADCPILQYGAAGRAALLAYLKGVVNQTKSVYARRFGIPESAADTCVKPGGDSGVFFDCASGISDRYADYQIRWVRESKDSPIAQFLMDSGVPYAPAPESPESLLVFGFPRESPKGSHTRNKHSAIEQCEMWLETKKNWAEHSVSVTIHVEEHEWPEVGAWVYKQENWDHLTGMAFLPKDSGTYTYPPNEELTYEKYMEFKEKFPTLNWSKLPHYEPEDATDGSRVFACTGDHCEM